MTERRIDASETAAVSPTEAETLYRQSEAEARRAGYCGLRHQQLVADLFKQKLGARTVSESATPRAAALSPRTVASGPKRP